MFSPFHKPRYHHLNKILIHRANLEFNYQSLKSFHPEAEIAPVVKSNAYGHGLTVVAPIFDTFKAPFLVVDSLFEAYELQKLHLQTPILILGYTHPDNFRVKKLSFQISVFDLETAKALNRTQCNFQAHIFVDTGMHREGVPLSDLRDFVQKIKQMPNLQIVGLCSHFADADNPRDQHYTQQQVKNYKEALQILRQEGIDPMWRHISASAGAFKIKDQTFNVLRVGLASYGIHPLESADSSYHNLKLKPALDFVSTLAQIKTIQKGDLVGYNGTFRAKKQMQIGLVPAGYYEGVDRRLSNKGFMMVRGVACPIVGRVSMNMTVIDVSQVDGVQVGDVVSIYSSDSNAPNSFMRVPELANTTPYELPVHLAESVRREVVE